MGASRTAIVMVLVAAASSVALPGAAVALAHRAPMPTGPSAVAPVIAGDASQSPNGKLPAGTPSPSSPAPTATAPAEPPPVDPASLPEARYDAVIPGLPEYASPQVTELARVAYSLRADALLSAEPGGPPIARFAATNFLGEPTVVVRVALQKRWALVLTPARSVLPSQNGGSAPAQTAGWMPVALLTQPRALTSSIVIAVSHQTLSIVTEGAPAKSFAVGVGTAATPTPQGVTGYLQARYLDANQHQTRFRVQLSSLHSAAADEPFGGSDGGLIGIHYERTATGAVSHGCVRLGEDAVRAVDALPLGTPLSIVG
ncbi:L,D-transpeptidase [Lacisediminihabitans changchengi]|uniref:L,D-transpeptidase family protein n=1 Tax=Lacisediminihabitans changchengi TaxID=2787634 RepID=A0A934SS24_9MICO|nr:L,D-transpeptidase [Lacisediminihabitans changchengi]MBK4346914.1 L,D-transpeptidase family protein [Lacisediminihabitans changchengi]MBK4347963.1 L,D-transpeptidase family protein [Lacisediminihabitans changchengi]